MSVQAFQMIVRQVASALRAEPDGLVDHTAGEAPAHLVPLMYRPPAAEKKEPETKAAVQKEPVRRHLPANFTCELCPDRLFPVRKFQRTGRIPVLLVYFNGSVNPTRVRPDKSHEAVLSSKEEDSFFSSLLASAGWGLDTFYTQQFPACHFNPERSSLADWTRRADHCLTHLRAAVAAAGIEHLLITSPSSQFLLGKEESQRLTQSGEEFLFEREGLRLTAHAIRRPDPKNPESQERLRQTVLALKKRFPS